MLSEDWIGQLNSCLLKLREQAEKPEASSVQMATYLQAMMCFGPGNKSIFITLLVNQSSIKFARFVIDDNAIFSDLSSIWPWVGRLA
jgi:hypothetical protein